MKAADEAQVESGWKPGRAFTRVWWRRIAIRAAVVLFAILVVRMTHIVESLTFYFPSRAAFVTPANAEDVTFVARDGVKLHGWFVRASDAKPGEVRPVIVHTHGNAGNIADHLAFSEHLAQAGFHVFLFDYRGYGRSDAKRLITRDDLVRDAHAALDAVIARSDVDREAIGVYGVSLGGVPALAIAAQRPIVKAVCTVSAFSSFPAVAQDVLPVLGPVLIPTGAAPRNFAAQLRVPYLIVHGTADEVVSARHAEILEAAAKEDKIARVQRAMVQGADHNGVMDGVAAQVATIAFFRQYLVRAP